MAKLIQDLSIGGNLRKLREARGLTQEDVCARMAQLGRPMLQSAYSQIETGRRNLFVSDLTCPEDRAERPVRRFFSGGWCPSTGTRMRRRREKTRCRPRGGTWFFSLKRDLCHFARSIRLALRMARTETPTSAKTAHHMPT